jgi:hypothetical protein
MSRLLPFAVFGLLAGCASSGEESEASNASLSGTTPLAAASAIAGTFDGSSTVYGLDANDQVVIKSTFTEHIVAENPVLADDRAYVTVTDTMTFSSGQTQTIPWEEGYQINPDGSTGSRYYTVRIPQVPPQTTIELATNDQGGAEFDIPFVARTDVHALGLEGKELTFAKHHMTKNVILRDGVEVDVLTRVTTIRWNQNGSEKTKTFVSLSGYQQRL